MKLHWYQMRRLAHLAKCCLLWQRLSKSFSVEKVQQGQVHQHSLSCRFLTATCSTHLLGIQFRLVLTVISGLRPGYFNDKLFPLKLSRCQYLPLLWVPPILREEVSDEDEAFSAVVPDIFNSFQTFFLFHTKKTLICPGLCEIFNTSVLFLFMTLLSHLSSKELKAASMVLPTLNFKTHNHHVRNIKLRVCEVPSWAGICTLACQVLV